MVGPPEWQPSHGPQLGVGVADAPFAGAVDPDAKDFRRCRRPLCSEGHRRSRQVQAGDLTVTTDDELWSRVVEPAAVDAQRTAVSRDEEHCRAVLAQVPVGRHLSQDRCCSVAVVAVRHCGTIPPSVVRKFAAVPSGTGLLKRSVMRTVTGTVTPSICQVPKS